MQIASMKSILASGLACCFLLGCSRGTSWFASQRAQAEVHFDRARFCMSDGDVQAAIDELHRAIAVDPKYVSAYTALGDLQRKRGDYPQAVESYETACRLDPYAFRPHYNLGVTYQALADLADGVQNIQTYLLKAVEVYIRALAIDAESFEARLNLGACYYRMGKYELAEQVTREALAMQPDSVRANNNLGLILETTGRDDQAILAYKASIEANPRQPSILLNLGLVYLRQGKLSSALATFKEASRLAPDSAEPWVQIGVCYFRMKQPDLAVRAFQNAIRRDPYHAGAYRGFGVVCMYQYVVDPRRTDLCDKALEAWRYSLRLEPGQEDLESLLRRYSPT